MISAIIGLPGVGKSLLCSYLGHRYLQGKSLNFHGFNVQRDSKGDTLYTNFPCFGAYKLDFDKLGIADYKDSFMLCDEIQLFADSRNFKTFGDNLTEWFTTHRKDHIDFVYCTQDFSMVDKRIRAVTDRIYYVDRVAFGLIRVRELLADMDLHGGLGWSYFYSSTPKLFIPRLMYKYNDTDYKLRPSVREPVKLIPWGNSSALSEQIKNKKEISIPISTK